MPSEEVVASSPEPSEAALELEARQFGRPLKDDERKDFRGTEGKIVSSQGPDLSEEWAGGRGRGKKNRPDRDDEGEKGGFMMESSEALSSLASVDATGVSFFDVSEVSEVQGDGKLLERREREGVADDDPQRNSVEPSQKSCAR